MPKKPDWKLQPETAMMSLGYEPGLSEGALDCPVFRSTTYESPSTQEAEERFKHPAAESTLIYSRFNHPNSQIFEERLAFWEDAELCASFSSGMAAIFAICFEFLNPGETILFSEPLYGASSFLFKELLPKKMGVQFLGFNARNMEEVIIRILTRSDRKLGMIFIETPANPTNELIDIELCRQYLSGLDIMIAVDNTFLGPLFQHPLKHGANISVYSATKFIGGHGDVVAGACVGSKKYIERLKKVRMILGSTLSPDSAWLLTRSLRTLNERMKAQAKNAREVAGFLLNHPKIEKLRYLGTLKTDDPDFTTYIKQCLAPGSMVSFDIRGDSSNVSRFLDSLVIFKNAVSLGGTESLAQRPHTMTHAGISSEEKERLGITKNMIRLSIGLEHYQDLIRDLDQALEKM